ncbi:MAG: bifunctional hydroxymethylpyrimidine kinase/phosphomethylpyrimidine kinase [Caulobacteraceae bacterium]|nr:bifunctional hydroxymethylpyrimidine kinase/phosphomethylpyrimidine kinase [Caulobacteraceae bacterium]
MPLALILSSHVAGSRVGGMAQVLALTPFGVDPVLAPTVLYGRHPGWGPPGGGPVEAATFAAMLDGIEANGLLARADLVICGYFALAGQVQVAAAAIDRVRAAGSTALVVVDPIMGDEVGGLYVKPEVAEAIESLLVPRADWLTPNAWELARLSGRPPFTSAAGAIAAARALGKPALVTSVPAGDGRIGLALVTENRATLFSHPRLDGVPHGGGDLVTAVFSAGLIRGESPIDAAQRAARAAADAAHTAVARGASELPLVALGERLVHPLAEVSVEVSL